MLDTARARRLLSEFQFEPLFIEELGWDRYGGHLDVAMDGATFRLHGVAEKRGMVAFLLAADGDLPDRATRRKIDQQAARSVHEHLIVYVDAGRKSQIWQWVRREPGQPAAVREHFYREAQSGEPLVQKLDALAFSLDEEAELSLVEVTRRARAAFDVERITKRFYDRFKAEHDAFLGFIEGLANREDLEWYASVTLNRLMFIYFIQKKGFLDGDRDYLRNRLSAIRSSAGPDQFHPFYRHFLLRLFHEGLGSRERTTELDALLGQVPYLNGGLFDVHELEVAHPSIEIPDDAFERLFDFFDSYQWYLDDRPLRADDEINPDVLGYIFEKYVNQKQMGAYYSKEDITDYITSNSLLPRLFEKLATSSPHFSFDSFRDLLAADPDRFIQPSLSHAHGEPFPEAITQGIAAFGDRASWGQPADEALRLHRSDTWRDVVTRRQRYEATRERLLARDLQGPADLVTLNLRLHAAIDELIGSCDSASQLQAIYHSLASLSVLDPTCGSGAFLFAALNILEPLYEGVIERMEALLRERGDSLAEAESFRSIIDRVNEHPSRSFFILKTITINNLYGVDILEEAVEICKLRLFLRLVSQIERVEDLEPLPDIDFNVRAGNSLVGYATADEVRASFEELSGGQRKLIFEEAASDYHSFEKRLEETDATFRAYQQMQTADASDGAIAETKHSLRDQLAKLANELNHHLARDYGVNPDRSDQYEAWKTSHQPFHWFAEFYGIVSGGGGGFDVIIGNPPYVEYGQVVSTYAVRDDEMVELGNLHAMVTLRCLRLLAEDGALGLVVPVALPSTSRFEGLREKLLERASIWTSHYDFRPSKLFEGAEQRLTIFVRHRADAPALCSTRFNRWYADERPYLFGSLNYTSWDSGDSLRPVWPKVPSDVGRSVLEKVSGQRLEVAKLLGRGTTSLYYKNTGMLYFTMFTRAAPICFINGEPSSSSRETQLRIEEEATLKPLHALLNSSLFYVMYVVHSNCRDLNPSDIRSFRLPESVLADERLRELSDQLDENHQANSEMRIRRQRLTGEVQIQTFQPARSKPVLDEIDRVLAAHYGFTDEETDFVISYDAKYRFGGDET